MTDDEYYIEQSKIKKEFDEVSRLHSAVQEKNVDLLRQYIQQGDDIDEKDGLGRTPLHYCAMFEALECAEELIRASGNVNAVDKGNDSPLHEAVKHKTPRIVQLLVQKGSDPFAENYAKKTPLHLCLTFKNVQNFRIISHSIDGEIKLHQAKHHGPSLLGSAVENELYECVQELIEWNVDVNEPTKNGKTPLLRATRKGNMDIAKLLIKKQANVHATDCLGNTVLHCRLPETGWVESLVDWGADVNAQNNKLETPLHNMIKQKSTENARTLLRLHANVNAKDKHGNTSLHIAMNNVECVKALLEADADTNLTNNDGATPLFKSVDYFAVQRLNMLMQMEMEGGATDNALPTPVLPYKPFRREFADCVRLLVEHGSDINSNDANGNTILHYLCASQQSAEYVKQLIDLGADINICNKKGYTPMRLALLAKRGDIVTLFTNAETHEIARTK